MRNHETPDTGWVNLVSITGRCMYLLEFYISAVGWTRRYLLLSLGEMVMPFHRSSYHDSRRCKVLRTNWRNSQIHYIDINIAAYVPYVIRYFRWKRTGIRWTGRKTVSINRLGNCGIQTNSYSTSLCMDDCYKHTYIWSDKSDVGAQIFQEKTMIRSA